LSPAEIARELQKIARNPQLAGVDTKTKDENLPKRSKAKEGNRFRRNIFPAKILLRLLMEFILLRKFLMLFHP